MLPEVGTITLKYTLSPEVGTAALKCSFSLLFNEAVKNKKNRTKYSVLLRHHYNFYKCKCKKITNLTAGILSLSSRRLHAKLPLKQRAQH